MQLNKNLPKGIAVLLFVLAIIAGFYYLNWDMKTVWNDENTWSRSSIFRLNYASQPTVEKRVSDSERYYVVPYCLLYEVVSDDTSIQYSCSFLPNYFRHIKDLNFAEVSYQSDVQLTVKKGSISPSDYLGDNSPTEDKLLSIGSNAPIPVSIEAKTKFTKPAPTFVKTVGHYFSYRLFKSKGILYVDEKITEWNITPYTETISQSELNDWSAEAWYDFQRVIDQESLKEKRGYDLFNTLSNEFEFYSYYCSPTKLVCTRDNALSPGSNMMLYMYTINRSGDESFAKIFMDEAKKYVLPFASNDNPSFKPKEPACENCDADFQDIQAYEFPICPVREIKENDYTHGNIALFSQFMRQYALDRNTQKPVYSQLQIISELNKLKDEAGKTSENREFVSDHVSRLNILCNGFVYYKMSGAANVGVLESTVYAILGERFGILTQDGKSQRLNSEQDLKRLIARSYMQGSFVNYVSDEIQAKKDIVDGFTTRSDMIGERRATINVGLTLYGIYLFSDK